MIGLLGRSIFKARTFGVQVYALLIAARDPRTPWHARILGLLVVAYLLSPIDLVPIVVPVFGVVDDLIIVPLGLKVVSTMIPAAVQADAKARAGRSVVAHPRFWRWIAAGIAVLLLIWLLVVALVVYVIVAWLW